ncbi:MAG TPA: cutinase family protein [Mycobacterium sp.]|nr:cutinase family protein [Mycobacterium sp.]
MSARHVARLLGAATAGWAALCATPIAVPSASAAACPDVEVVFARATTEPPGVGSVGKAFVNSLRSQVGGKSVGVYAVNYPASEDFASSASIGANDARAHVQSTAATCPGTRMVLGGYSQGAMVVDLITAIPVSFAGFTPAPMPPDVADHVSAVAVFGNPLDRYVGTQLNSVSPDYGGKTIDLCAAGDPICTPSGDMSTPTHDEMFSAAHLSYVTSGMASQAASFAASHV